MLVYEIWISDIIEPIYLWNQANKDWINENVKCHAGIH